MTVLVAVIAGLRAAAKNRFEAAKRGMRPLDSIATPHHGRYGASSLPCTFLTGRRLPRRHGSPLWCGPSKHCC